MRWTALRVLKNGTQLPHYSVTVPFTFPWNDADLRVWLRRRLLAWFNRQRRDLPWRRSRDPYAIWVSEVMLQQTQVATVIPYFERFLAAFPDIATLAAADEQQVLCLWEGLGYYRRARSLHQAARQIVAQHNGRFPNDPATLAALPGFGRYTIGAVLSQAFDRRLPILEANSRRVLCRLFALRGHSRSSDLEAQLWQAAEALLPRKQVGEFNQAIMELGALICTVSAAHCSECPLQARCQARQLGLQMVLPERSAGLPVELVQEAAAVIERQGKVLLVQRPSEGRWANLWEFPRDRLQEGETHEEAATRIAATLAGIQADVGGELLTVRHGVTRFQITLVALAVRHRSGDYSSGFYQQGRWLHPEELRAYPVSSAQRKLTRAIGAGLDPGLF